MRQSCLLKYIVIALLCEASVLLSAQTVNKNAVAIGGDISLFTTTDAEDPSASVYLSPYVEYYPLANGAVAVKYIIDVSKLTGNNLTTISTRRTFQPYIRYFIYKGLSVLAGTQFEHEYKYQPNLHWGAGYSFFAGKMLAITPLLEINNNFYKYAPMPLKFNFSIGVSCYFNRKG